MHFRAFAAVLLAIASVSATLLPGNHTLEKRASATAVSNCVGSGQVALTFDGPHTLHSLVLYG